MEQIPVVLESLGKTFQTFRGRVDVLEDVTLTIEKGEFFVILGPSGCGKSTLLNLVAGLEKPSAGRITIGERVVADPAAGVFLQPFERDVAMVFQSYALYPHMTVEQNIAFPLTNQKTRPSKEETSSKARSVAALLRIEELLDRRPAELSGGQRQRVAIGRAIVREPTVFLLDEPLSNLDAQLRMDMRAQLKALQRSLGVTTLYVTHDQMEAMTLGDRVAIIRDGRIHQLGTPVEIYDHPVDTFVARFIGSPPMNLIEGTLTGKERGAELQVDDLSVSLPDRVVESMRAKGGERHAIGIRPEHVAVGEPGAGSCDVDIDVVENIGGEFLMYIFLKESQIVVRSPHRPSGKRVSLMLDPERIHVFS